MARHTSQKPCDARTNGQHGFTLIDLLATLTIASVILTIAVPGLEVLILTQHRSAVMNNFIATLHLARTVSITRGRRAVVCPSRNLASCDGRAGTGRTVWHEGYIVFLDLNANQNRDPEEPVIHAVGQIRKIRITSSAGRSHVTYQATGLASGTNATFEICAEGDPIPGRALVLSNTGRVRVAPPSASVGRCSS